MQGHQTTQGRPIKDGTHSGQGGGHGDNGQAGLYRQGTFPFIRHQYIQDP